MYSLTSLFNGFNKNARAVINGLFMSGVKSPNANHLEGEKRRIYNSGISAAHQMLLIAKAEPSVQKLIESMMRSSQTALITMAIVDDELRVNGYLGSFHTDHNHHRVGEHRYAETGIATALITRQELRGEHTRYSMELLSEPQRRLAYNPYDPEFSWSMELDNIDADRMLHHSMYKLVR